MKSFIYLASKEVTEKVTNWSSEYIAGVIFYRLGDPLEGTTTIPIRTKGWSECRNV